VKVKRAVEGSQSHSILEVWGFRHKSIIISKGGNGEKQSHLSTTICPTSLQVDGHVPPVMAFIAFVLLWTSALGSQIKTFVVAGMHHILHALNFKIFVEQCVFIRLRPEDG
jgi:hypothetical protein